MKKSVCSVLAAGAVLSMRGEAKSPAQFVSPITGRTEEVRRLEVQVFVPSVERGGLLQLRALGRSPSGDRLNVTRDVQWEVSPSGRGTVDQLDRLVGGEAGTARVTARLGGVRSVPVEVTVLEKGRPDWDVTHIERMRGEESAGRLSWCVHVKNYGTADAPRVPVEWRIDGKRVLGGLLPKVERFRQTELVLSSPADGPHELELVVDPDDEVPETSEANNRLRVNSEARTVGFWVEESTLRYFHRHQRELGIGSNSWEDWAQRQVAYWNGSQGCPPLSSDSEQVRSARASWRLDRIVVVGDGVLPLAGGSSALTAPARRDGTLHVMRGFPAYDPARSDLYRQTTRRSNNPFFFEASLMDGVLSARRD